MQAPPVDEHGRHVPPFDADEVDSLVAFLEWHRESIAWKCRGLDDAQLNATTAASSMTLGGLLKHLAFVEDLWCSRMLAGVPPAPPWDAADWGADPRWDWTSAADDSAEELMSLWEASVERSRGRVGEALSKGGLDQMGVMIPNWSRPPRSLRWILLHMALEYARHLGHADLLREAIDGETGE